VWWAAALSNWWGPDPTVGLVVSAVVGAAIVLSRFRGSARSAGNAL
jgi:hypothetical protein